MLNESVGYLKGVKNEKECYQILFVQNLQVNLGKHNQILFFLCLVGGEKIIHALLLSGTQ